MTKPWDKAKSFLCLSTLMILLSMVSASLAQQRYPWETALNEQLKWLKENYRNHPQDIIVVHLGITDRDEQAFQIAKSLTEALGPPVIALPSYSGDPRKDDIRKTVVQYCNSQTYPVHFEKAWEKIIADGHRVVGLIIHSGAGLRANTERKNLINFIENNPGKIIGNVVFVDTDLKGLTQKDFKSVGLNCIQLGKIPFVAWVTKPAARYIPFGEYLGPPATFLGWVVPWGKVSFGVPAIVDAVRGFPDHPLSRRIAQIRNALNLPTVPRVPTAEGKTVPLETGGIDFSSINIQYFSEYQDRPLYVMGAAFRGIPSKAGQGIDLQQASELSWDSLFIWLALPNSAFWVNLNPAEPGRIIDRELGKTDVGRILLEADFQMKKDVARLTHPNSQLGRQFWDKIYNHIMGRTPIVGPTQIAIPVTFRVWIVPGQVVVWATEENIYVVNGQMEVKLETEYLSRINGVISSVPLMETPGTSENQKYAEGLLKEMILPALVKEVNTGSQYQELRQVFYSRVIAEWYKIKHRSGKQAFRRIVGQGNTDPWRSAGAWSAREIFERYKQSLSKGEYSLTEERETRSDMFIIKTIRKYFTGGVDFRKIPMIEISYEQLLTQKPEVREQLFDALLTPTGHWNREVWVGGIYVAVIPESGSSINRR